MAETAENYVEGVAAFEVYTAARNLLPVDCDDRLDVASLVMHMAIYGDNVKAIAKRMCRSERWVYERRQYAIAVFDPRD